MFNLFNKSKQDEQSSIILKIKGMHCSSCAMNIDNNLEETEGIFSSSTNYPKSELEIKFDQKKMNKAKIKNLIQKLGYQTE